MPLNLRIIMSISDLDKKHIWHPFTQMKTAQAPLPIEEGKVQSCLMRMAKVTLMPFPPGG